MALTETLSTTPSHALVPGALPELGNQEVPVVQPSYSFEGNDCETVIDVHLPGVQRRDVSIQLTGHHLLIVGKCFAAKKKVLQPSLEYVLHVQLDAPVDRKDVNAAMRSFDTLRVRIPAFSR